MSRQFMIDSMGSYSQKTVISTTAGRRNPLAEAVACLPEDVSRLFDMTVF
ncbi:MAG TPA: hypothetical protein G4N94_12540 [Caldilineae bacterium]|nr:hypothetical protein [Caldilineae bacterium]